MADHAGVLGASVSAVTDVQLACIPVINSATKTAFVQVAAGGRATYELKTTLGL